MGEKIRILIADEEENSRQILSRILLEEGYDVTAAASSEDALEAFRKEPYPLLVLDVRTWERNGIETLLEMKRQHPETEIIISSSDDSMGTALLAIRAGVNADLMQPFRERDLVTYAVRRVAEKIHIRREKKFLVETLERRNRELDQRNTILPPLATHDGLTGLSNHGHFQETLANEVDRSRRAGKVFSLLLLDIDNFKQYNDSHGHSHGDDVLRRLGELLRKRLRKSDLPARYGGGGFIVLLPETNKEYARGVAGKIRKNVERHPFPGRETQPSGKLTVSVSVVSFPEDGTEPSLLTYNVDRALSRAKGKGRNVVCLRATPAGRRKEDVRTQTSRCENPRGNIRKKLWFDIPLRTGFVNITRNVDAHLKESGTREGLCLGKKKESVFLLGIFHFHRPFRLVQALPPENSKSRLELIPR